MIHANFTSEEGEHSLSLQRHLLGVGLVSLFNSISTFVDYLLPKAELQEYFWYYFTNSWDDKGVHTFPKGICPKVNSLTTIPQSSALTITPRGQPLAVDGNP